MLEPLLTWVAGYYTGSDQWSYAYHRRVFDVAGRKRELTELPIPAPESPLPDP